MAFKFVALAALLAVAHAGGPAGYDIATATGDHASIGYSQESTHKGYAGQNVISSYSRAEDSAHSSVRVSSSHASNDAVLSHEIGFAAAPVIKSAYAAAPVVTKAYAAPAYEYAAHAAPVLAKTAYAAPAYGYAAHAAPVIAKTAYPAQAYSYAAPVVAKTAYAAPAYSYAAPVVAKTAYAAPAYSYAAPVVAKAAYAAPAYSYAAHAAPVVTKTTAYVAPSYGYAAQAAPVIAKTAYAAPAYGYAAHAAPIVTKGAYVASAQGYVAQGYAASVAAPLVAKTAYAAPAYQYADHAPVVAKTYAAPYAYDAVAAPAVHATFSGLGASYACVRRQTGSMLEQIENEHTSSSEISVDSSINTDCSLNIGGESKELLEDEKDQKSQMVPNVVLDLRNIPPIYHNLQNDDCSEKLSAVLEQPEDSSLSVVQSKSSQYCGEQETNYPLQQRIQSLGELMINLKEELRRELELWKKEKQEFDLLREKNSAFVLEEATAAARAAAAAYAAESPLSNRLGDVLDISSEETIRELTILEYEKKLAKYQDEYSFTQAEQRYNTHWNLVANAYKQKLIEVEQLCNEELEKVRENASSLQPLKAMVSQWYSDEDYHGDPIQRSHSEVQLGMRRTLIGSFTGDYYKFQKVDAEENMASAMASTMFAPRFKNCTV